MAKKKHPQTWKRKLKALREKHGLSQAEAAIRTGVALRTWIAWENRQNIPGRLALNLLRTAFSELR